MFGLEKLHRKKYMEMTKIFQSAKLHKKVHGNDVEIRRNLAFDVLT